ncbi:uncharacterized protein CcaverHIS019_0608000 [Cutaneotrichosporon cavernicola]|uniref:UDP-glucose:glycoprotein glucosyltransferase n=1 Tax=Cutaneotrichosporon cavernicola TaxID=279322 RepID=A0AA48L8X8_9TREE|nr:uncharacterized protein CcaverHIS019_0608000 [Cutaneotrichosporon cavernicola]BEI94341.1 hypothetical protein CcaverHIS019_0608000 [Cutaneotrichosporon cavernicola]BEJ02118.1 hypothetical protein CcaverHIS631_0608000 [Cutaneotrichosporon cavernicola]BEJ09879.1 hypothetical protein CcaverHIS641_0607940 [Cutaneotrichosporon cavernicola]
MRWLAALLAAVTVLAAPPLSVSVETAWPTPPLLLEILEVAYDESPSSYFDILHLLSFHLAPLTLTPQETLDRATSLLDTHALLTGERDTFQLALSLHTAAPRIAAAFSANEEDVPCDAWVKFHGSVYCDAEPLSRAVSRGIEAANYTPEHIEPDPFDRTRGPGLLSAVLYYSPTPAALPLLEVLDEFYTAHPTFSYAVRYTSQEGGERTKLSGYGVEMALKKTDYLVVDDRQTVGTGDEGMYVEKDRFESVLGKDPWSEPPLTKPEIKNIGVAATALIKAASDPMAAFVALAQDIPKYAAALARKVEVPQAIRSRVFRLGFKHPLGPALYINGRAVQDRDMNAFSLLSIVRRERHWIKSLMAIGLSPKHAYELISDPIVGEAATEVDPLEGLVDASDRPEGGGVVVFLNDLEKDITYSRWPNTVQSFLRPIHPGQLHYVRLNAWNAISVLDLASMRGAEMLASSISQLVQRNLPIHMGVVPMFDTLDGPSAQMARVFYYLADTQGSMSALQLITAIVMSNQDTKTKTVDLGVVRQLYDGMYNQAKQEGEEVLSFDEVLASPELGERLNTTKAYLERLGAMSADSATGHLFVNGIHSAMQHQWTMQLQQVISSQLVYLQESIRNDEGPTQESISTFFYDLPTTGKRRNKVILPSPDNELRAVSVLDVFEDEAAVLAKQFIYPKEATRATPLSIWIVGDLDSKDGHALLEGALRNIDREGSATRVSFVHVPNEASKNLPGPRLSTVLFQLTAKEDSSVKAGDLLDMMEEVARIRTNLVEVGEIRANADPNAPLNSFVEEGWSGPDTALAARFWETVGSQVADVLGLKGLGLLVNGRVLSVQQFTAEDFVALEAYELRKRVQPVVSLLKTYFADADMSRDHFADMVAVASSVIAAAYTPHGSEGIWIQQQPSRSRSYESIDEGEISFSVGNKDGALVRVAAVLDPVSEEAQRWSALIQWISSLDSVSTTVWLDPDIQMDDFKVKRFYRSALRTCLTFDVDGNEVLPAPTFHGLPSTPIYTLGMEVSPSWIVSPKDSPLDLDNILLSTLSSPTTVAFDLKLLVVDGHAREAASIAPRGLQLQLSTANETMSDTQVMANLGYFQFKARPGVYDFAIRPGRGREVFEIESAGADGWDSPPANVSGTKIRVDSFDGMTLYPRFLRRAGMEDADVLVGEEVAESLAGSIVSKLKSLVGLAPAPTKPASRHADINIFTVASGLLYERFASIMILSVLKHTDSTVKFWFIENFLSPTFLRFLPAFAEKYGFQYELVTYKWPHWLRAQTEKQRIIWAYKILFLDVLFPMDLDKVIFVDADQIVRTDMRALVDLDLQGHVYAYPPMGDDRTEMEGFRFWKTGYWVKELQGRPYHISALYVVDLRAFRAKAAGDRLRGTYQALSADPNSLANLDQDLPNSMQRQLPIFTLDRDWLWCQTWCSDESLATAKTIDLCQNPLTKEPKLSRARQIPEWDSYDREIAEFAATLGDGGLAANVDDLASGPGGAGAGAVGDRPDSAHEAQPAEAGQADTERPKDEL